MKIRTIIIIDSEPELKHYLDETEHPTEAVILLAEQTWAETIGIEQVKDCLVMNDVPCKIDITVKKM